MTKLGIALLASLSFGCHSITRLDNSDERHTPASIADGGETLSRTDLGDQGDGDKANAARGHQDDAPPIDVIDCFPGDTLVLTPKGNVRIDDLRAGDYVIDGAQGEQVRVIEVTSALALHAIRVALSESEVIASRGHRFTVQNRGMVEAQRLERGDLLRTKTGQSTLIESVDPISYEQGLRVFSLEFERRSDILVGTQSVRAASAK